MNTETSYFLMRKIMLGEQRLGFIMIQLPKSTLNNVDTTVENLSVNPSQAYTIGNKLVYNFTDIPLGQPDLQKLEHIDSNYSDKRHFYGEEHHIVASVSEKAETLCGACFTFSITAEEPLMLSAPE